MGSQTLLLDWNEHKSNMINELQQLFSHSEMTDVTLACDGYTVQAHKTVLSACSTFFRSLFLHHPCKHAFVILTEVDSDDLKAIVDFMYRGKIHIPQEKVPQFLKTAGKLKVKGLSAYSEKNLKDLTTDADSRCTLLEHNDPSSERQPNRSSDSFQTDGNSRSGQLERTDLPSESQPVRSHLDETFHPNSSSRGESLEHTDTSESHPVRSHEVESFKTNESQSLTSAVTTMDSSSSYMDLKNESREMELSVQEYCSISILEPQFSPSLHNITSRPSEISNSQSFSMPVPPVVPETPHWVSPVFPTGDMHGPSAYVTQIGNPAGQASTSSSKECPKLGNHSHSYHFAKFPARAHDKPFFANSLQCHSLQRTFISKSKLPTHERSNAQVQTFRCTVCNKRFRQKHGLKYHMMAHFGEKPYSCNICDRKFCRPYSLTVHERIHTGEKPFVCTYCGKRFSDKSNLLVHVRSH